MTPTDSVPQVHVEGKNDFHSLVHLLLKNGFVLRCVVCPRCKSKLIHPVDEQEYVKYANLKNKEFRVKMRLVGNSYAVSIPKEIVSFMNEQKEIMDKMVKLCFEYFGKLSLNFNNENIKKELNKELGK